LILLGFALAVVGALFAGAWGVVQYERSEISSLSDAKARLQREVGELEAKADNWSLKAGRAVTSTCGGRMCVEVDTKSPPWGKNNEYYIIKGY
jgi:hypothetical protein